ncbi:PEGA domain-containing protein [Patescibacteria group bacterium]
MEYNQVKRRIFFWFLVVLFLATAPTIFFYAMGYRFNTERGIFIYSGSFTIKSNPQETEILIDKETVPKGIVNFLNYSYHIDGLKPGEYQLELKHPNYQTWHKKASIHSGISTEFWNIFLARENYTRKEYLVSPVAKFFISPREENIAIVKDNEHLEIEVLNTKEELTIEIIQDENYYFSRDLNYNIEWSPKGDRLLIPVLTRENHEKNYLIAALKGSEAINLNEFLEAPEMKNVRWDPSEKNHIFYISENKLFKANIENPLEEKILFSENVSNYDISGNEIYFIKNTNGIIYESDVNGRSTKQISTTSLQDINFTELKIIAYDKDRIAIITGDKDLYIYNKNENVFYNKLSNNVLGVHFSNDGKKLVYWTKNEILVYFAREWETQPQREENQIIQITRSFSAIDNVQWFKDYEHIIYTNDGKIRIIELDRRDYRNMANLAELNIQDSKSVYNHSKNIIYFTDSTNENIDLNAINLSEEDDEELEF